MRAAARLALVAFTAVSSTGARDASADESFNQPIFGILTTPIGARSGWGGPDAAIAGGGLFAGGRWSAFRFGLLGQALWWRASPDGLALDVGGFVSLDGGSLWLDPQLSAAWFVRLEPATFRWVLSSSHSAYAPALEIGARAVGIELGIAGGPEVGLQDPGTGASRIGGGAELRLGFDLVEIGFLGAHIAAGGQPLAH